MSLGEEEAELTLRGTAGGRDFGPSTVVVDIGGGSLEIAHSFEFDPRGGRALLELAPVPSWHELQYRR